MLLERLVTICLFAMLVFLAFPSFAYAYLDPGTGSYVFQLLIAGLAGSLFLVKIYWKRIGAFFTRLFSKGESSADENGCTEDEEKNA